VGPISALYRQVWAPWQNFFLPCFKLQEKWRQGSHWRKRYELPRTAYQRLSTPGILTLKKRRELRDRYESLDPFALKDELETKLKEILKPKPAEGLTPKNKTQVFDRRGARARAQSSPPCSFYLAPTPEDP